MRDMVVHAYLGLPIDEVQTNATSASKVATFLGNNLLEEDIDGACNITHQLLPIIGRGVEFIG